MRIGLLGGAFNPAHEGHLYISTEALKRCDLDQIWWVVSFAHPFKSKSDGASFQTRTQKAKMLTKHHPNIHVSTIEQRYGTRYSVDTVQRLKQHYREHQFIWLMGADNLIEISKWHRWETLFSSIPIAVFDRAPYRREALSYIAAKRFAAYRIDESDAALLPYMSAPAWSFLHLRGYDISSTELRR